jgi:hypothetical protein
VARHRGVRRSVPAGRIRLAAGRNRRQRGACSLGWRFLGDTSALTGAWWTDSPIRSDVTAPGANRVVVAVLKHVVGEWYVISTRTVQVRYQIQPERQSVRPVVSLDLGFRVCGQKAVILFCSHTSNLFCA